MKDVQRLIHLCFRIIGSFRDGVDAVFVERGQRIGKQLKVSYSSVKIIWSVLRIHRERETRELLQPFVRL